MAHSKAFLGFAMGLPFGVALHKSGLSNPDKIKQQFQLKDFTMMKTFLSAVGSGMLVVAIGKTAFDWKLQIKPHNVLADAVGGAMLGGAMSLIGSCPGTVLAQMGAGYPVSSPFVFAGGVLGAATFGLLSPSLTLFSRGGEPCSLAQKAGLPWLAIASPVLAGIGGALCALHRFTPSSVPRSPGTPSTCIIARCIEAVTAERWNPFVSGSVIGLMQLPAFTLAGTFLGTSSAFVTIAGHILALFNGGRAPNSYFLKNMNADSYWQLALDVGIVLGAYVAKKVLVKKHAASEEDEAVKPPLSWKTILSSATGGFLLVFGARIANGCTSGHGLSGLAQLACSSLVAVPSMFAAGLLTAKLTQFFKSRS